MPTTAARVLDRSKTVRNCSRRPGGVDVCEHFIHGLVAVHQLDDAVPERCEDRLRHLFGTIQAELIGRERGAR